jgi:hypothetical protein
MTTEVLTSVSIVCLFTLRPSLNAPTPSSHMPYFESVSSNPLPIAELLNCRNSRTSSFTGDNCTRPYATDIGIYKITLPNKALHPIPVCNFLSLSVDILPLVGQTSSPVV